MFRLIFSFCCLSVFPLSWMFIPGDQKEGAFKYEDFDKSSRCKMCHKEIYTEWDQSMMSKSFTHKWDEVEYFKLALPHALKLEKVAGVKAGCIGCHSPLAFLAGDIPPKTPDHGTRANEGVCCDICHTITGSSEEPPYNFSYIIEPGRKKLGQRKKTNKSSFHETAYSSFISAPELCATCHDEQSPYGAWVKTTYREWKAGPYSDQGVRCQDCHMYYAPGKSTGAGLAREDMSHHNFHGSHEPGKLKGAVDVALYCDMSKIFSGKKLKISVNLFNGKAGHFIPSGSTEERMLWLEVTAIDASGKVYSIPVDKKGFNGEEFTIADPNAVAYQAMGEIMEIDGFAGISRDGKVPSGCRIFRRPFFDPKGRMTICQWYTSENEKIDYRIGPRKTIIENYSWKAPDDIAKGPLILKAALYYSQIPSSVGEFLQLPEDEYAPILVNSFDLSGELF